MASNKEIRRLIKAARTAYDKGNYEEAIKECQAVFWLEEDHYLSHVITGKAYLQLKDRQNSLTHYRKAKSCDQNELLAWKGLVDLYDNYPPQDDTERLEAIESYERVLNNVSDGEREMTIISKLADLHMRLKQFDKATNYFISLLLSPSHQVSSLRYLLSHPHHSLSQWPLIRDTYNSLAVTMETPLRLEIKKLFLSSSIVWIKLLEDRNIELFDGLREVCSLDGDHDEIHVLLQLALWDSIYDFNVSNKCFPSHHLEPLNEQLSHEKEGQGAWFPCHCISLLLSKKLKDVISLIAENEPTTCEGHLVSCVCHMMSHDYATTISEARTGLSMLNELPLFLHPKVKLFLNSLLAEAYLWTKTTDNVATSLSLTQQMCLEWSHDCHVTWLHVRALIANGHFQSIDKILSDCPLNEDVSIIIQAELHMMKTDYKTAIEKLRSLSTPPSNGYYHYLLGYCLWMNGSRQDSYPVLIKSAQLDPYNPYCYLYLGHYHSLVSSDKK
jgi:superkiller protein 3